MGYLLINKIDINKINIKDTKYFHRITYKTEYIELKGLYFRINDIHLSKYNNEHIVTINNINSLKLLESIDIYLQNKLSTNSFIKNKKLVFKQNSIIDKLLCNYTNYLDINISVIKKHAYQSNPLVYIL